MTDLENTVTLTVDGLDYGGWKSVSISAGLERQARDFNLSITWRWPGQAVSIPIRHGAKCMVRIGGDLILTGWVFATPISYDATQITLSISRRSMTAELIVDARNAVGECPVWVPQENALYWVDIPNGGLQRWDAAPGHVAASKAP